MNVDLEKTLKVFALVGAVGSFLWGVFVWRDDRQRERESAKEEQVRLAEARRIESTKPFLERQLKLYTEATEAASILSTTNDKVKREKAQERFWQLYWGELAMVENKDVEAAMKHMGDALNSSASQGTLQRLSLDLARACRISLDSSWGINAWTSGSTYERLSQ